jgi:sugar diacid utilization regulator
MAAATARTVRDGKDVPEDHRRALKAVVAQWVSSGLEVDSVLEACRDGGAHVLSDWANEPYADRLTVSSMVVRLVSECTIAVNDAFSYRSRSHPDDDDAARAELAHALILNRPHRTELAARLGMTLSSHYVVVVLDVSRAAGTRRAVAIRGAIDSVFGRAHGAMFVLGVRAVTVLVPAPAEKESIDALVARLDGVLGTSVLGATAEADSTDLGRAIDFASELIAIATSLGRRNKLYRTHELVLEYQMSRPGPGRDAMAAVLDPLRDRPVLLDTITTYIKCQQSRRLASKALYIHTNTLDNRLRKVSEVLGFDIGSVMGQRKLEAAIFLEDLDRVV